MAQDVTAAFSKLNVGEIYPTRLHDRQIRLLELLPGTGSTDVKCRLLIVNLETKPKYEALSYDSSDSTSYMNAICNNRSFPVTTNLYHALHCLRKPDASRMLWVKATCINHQDLKEKSAQVTLMPDVISQASRVVVCLDPGNDANTKLVKNATQKIYAACATYAKSTGEDLIEMSRDTFSLPYADFRATDLPDATWEAVEKFFALPWFSRIWSVLEVIKAKDSAVLYGTMEFLWLEIAITAEWNHTEQVDHQLELPEAMENVLAFNAQRIFEADEYAATGLLRILTRFRDFHAIDKRDKVYALMGLLQWPGGECPMKFDYEQSAEKLYIETARLIIQELGDPALLSSASWVPDWSTNHDVMTLWLIWSEEENWFMASADNKMTAFYISEGGILSLSGLVFDTVAYTSDVLGALFANAGTTPENSKALLELWHECSVPSAPYTSEATAIETMAQTLTAGLSGDSELLAEREEEERQVFFSEFLLFMKEMQISSGSPCRTFDPMELSAEEGDWHRYQVAATRACLRRRFFRTSRGYYALGPACMRTGDIVAVLDGARVPYALRPTEKGHLFLGECYVYDIMFGEAFGKYREYCEEKEFNLV